MYMHRQYSEAKCCFIRPMMHRNSITGLLYVPAKHKRAYVLVVAVAAVLPVFGCCYLSTLVWNKQVQTGAATVVAAQRMGHSIQIPTAASQHGLGMTAMDGNSSSGSGNGSCSPIIKVIPVPSSTAEVGRILQQEGFSTGAELGMHLGKFAYDLLTSWTSCARYYMVYASGSQQPPSKPVTNNAHHLQQHKVLSIAEQALQPFGSKVVWLHEWTSAAAIDAAALIQQPVEFVYVNAQFDVCAALSDVRTWWQHLRPGGIIAGQPLIRSTAMALKQHGRQGTILCPEGTLIDSPIAAQAALEEFLLQQGVRVVRASGTGPNSSSSSSSIGVDGSSGGSDPGGSSSSSNLGATNSSSSSSSNMPAWQLWLARKPYYPCSGEQPAGRQAVRADPLTQLLSHMQQQSHETEGQQRQQPQQQQEQEGQEQQEQQQQQQEKQESQEQWQQQEQPLVQSQLRRLLQQQSLPHGVRPEEHMVQQQLRRLQQLARWRSEGQQPQFENW